VKSYRLLTVNKALSGVTLSQEATREDSAGAATREAATREVANGAA